jgi:alcohol dehydrogenase class IV
MEYVPSLYLPKVKELASALRVDFNADEDNEAVLAKVVEKIRLLQHKTGLPSDFTEYNLTEEDLDRVAAAVAKDPAAVSFPMPKELIQAVGQQVVPIGVK